MRHKLRRLFPNSDRSELPTRERRPISRAALEEVYESVAHRSGSLDFVFNNAGIGATLPLAEASAEQWDRILAVNLRAVIDGTSVAYKIMAALPACSAHGRGAPRASRPVRR